MDAIEDGMYQPAIGELMAILDLAAGRRRSPRPEVITNALAVPAINRFGRKPISERSANPGITPTTSGTNGHNTRRIEAKILDFSGLCGAITGFGTQGSQVRILPLRPLNRKGPGPVSHH